MDLEILKKKLSAFKGEGGRIRNVSDEMLLEVLSHWENYKGSAKDFYKGIGSSQKGIVSLIGKAKRLKREGASTFFNEVKIEGTTNLLDSGAVACDIEVVDSGKVIRFRKVDLLIEFLKKAA